MFRASQIYGASRATPAPRAAQQRPLASVAPRGKGAVDWNDSHVRDAYREEVAAARQQKGWQGGKGKMGGYGGKDSWYASSWGPGSDGGGYDDGWWSDGWGKSGGKGASADDGWWTPSGSWGKAGGKGAGADGDWWSSSADWGKASAKGNGSTMASPSKGNGSTSSGAGCLTGRRPMPPLPTAARAPASSSGMGRSGLPARVPTLRADMPPITPNTVTLQGSGLQNLGEAVVDEACRQVAIDGGFSVHENLRFVNPGAAYVEFPYSEAAARFTEATSGDITIQKLTFKVRHPLGSAAAATLDPEKQEAGDAPDGVTPTDSLMIKNLAEIPEPDLRAAFEKIAPRIKAVKVIKDYAGHYKGMGTVSFYDIHEASMALRHFRSQGCMIAGRKVTAEFLAPSTLEQKVELEDKKQKADESLRASHAQALSGVNADMWASYLAMFKEEGGQEEPEAKRARGNPNFFT